MAKFGQESAFVSPWMVRLIAREFGTTTERTEALLANTRLHADTVFDPNLLITIPTLVQVFANVSETVGEDWALRLPATWSEGSQAEFGLAIRSAPDVGHVLDIWSEYAHTRWPMAHFVRIVESDRVKILVKRNFHIAPDTWKSIVLLLSLNTFVMINSISDQFHKSVFLEYGFDRPSCYESFAKVITSGIAWNCKDTSVAILRSALTQKLPYGDARSFAIAVDALRERAAQIATTVTYASRVSQCLSFVDEGRMDLPETSRRLGLSVRSLERGLASEGTSFSQLTDQSLSHRLDQLISGPHLATKKIAEKLGFSDVTSLYRAIRRWHGITMSQLKARTSRMPQGDADQDAP